MQNVRSSRAGSTLIEVLVVTGLIALMIALLLPVVQTSAENFVPQKFASTRIAGKSASQHKLNSIRTARL